MGRQIKVQSTDWAYIAGFLDGDGSVMVQIKKRKDTKRGWRLMFTVCFYQDSRHEKPLIWIKRKLGIGYISKRNDGITEFRINGFKQLGPIMTALYPYVKFKKKQVSCAIQILQILDSKENLFTLDKSKRKKIARLILKARQENYQSGSKRVEKLKEDLEKIVNG